MASLINPTPTYRRRSIKIADDLTAGSQGTGLLDLVELAWVFSQAEAKAKKEERSLSTSNMIRATQGITVNNSVDDIQSSLDYINDQVKEDPALKDAADALKIRLSGTLERRIGIDGASEDIQKSRNALRKLEKKATETGDYSPSEVENVLKTIGDSYIKNERYLDGQQVLKTRYSAIMSQAADMYEMLSLIDQADAIKYIKDEATGLEEGAGLQLPAGTEGMPIEFKGLEVTRADVARFAEDSFQARQYASAKQALNTLSIDMSAKGMKMAREIRSAGPLINNAVLAIKNANKDSLPEELRALPNMQSFFNNMQLTSVTSPEQIQKVFNILSEYIFRAADLEEMVGPPHSVQELDEYLASDRVDLLEDLDELQKVIVNNLLQARDILSKAYQEAFGTSLIIPPDTDLTDILNNIIIR